MMIKHYKVFTLDRILIYILPPVLLIVAFFAALVHGTTPLLGLGIFGVVILAWLGMSSILFGSRAAFKNRIKAQTADGTNVIPDYVTQPDLSTLCMNISNIEMEVINFWAGNLQKSIFIFMDYLNGGIIGFTKDVIDLEIHSPTGPLLIDPGFQRYAVGVTKGNWSCVQYSGELSDWPRAQNCIRHEVAHKCLSAALVPDDQHHEMMARYKFGY